MEGKDRILQIEKRLAQLESERQRLLLEIEGLKRKTEKSIHPTARAQNFSPEQKISLFLSLFRCREEIVPKLWENPSSGKKGYSPVCRNEWVNGVCEKPRIKCHECRNQGFERLDEKAAREHLEGRTVIGTYAIREDDTAVIS